jgi:hypothetical protein
VLKLRQDSPVDVVHGAPIYGFAAYLPLKPRRLA